MTSTESYLDDSHNGNSTGKAAAILAQRCGVTANLDSFASIKLLDPSCTVHQNIVEYVKNSADSIQISVVNIYAIQRTGAPTTLSNKYKIILWHGTCPSSVPGILQYGFKMGSGGLFGGGIYFADRIAKSAGYAKNSPSGTYFFILAEVAPGKVYKSKNQHSNYSTAPTGFDSVKATASRIPKWKDNKDYKGAILPSGITVNNARHPSYNFGYNEYIMYDSSRIVVRFVVECTRP